MQCIKILFFTGSVIVIAIFTISYILLDHYYWHTIIPQQTFAINTIISSSIIKPPEYFNSNINENNNIISINQVKQKWQLLFFYIFIKNELLPILLQNKLYSFSINNLLSKHPKLNKISKQNAINSYNKLLDITFNYFSNSNSNSIQFVINNKHNIISIRRYIIILHQTLSINNASISYEKMLNKFIELHKSYIETIKTHKKYKRIFYNIHISKSAGTTICDTAVKNAGKRSTKQNCNLPNMGTPIKTLEYKAKSCEEIDNIVSSHGNLEFIAQESPMSGHQKSMKPILCNKYSYILSIRKPMS